MTDRKVRLDPDDDDQLVPDRIDPSSGSDGEVLKRVSGTVTFATDEKGTAGGTVVSGSPTLVQSGDVPYDATAGEFIQVNLGGSSGTINLPTSPSQGDAVGIQALNGNDTITVDPGGNSIESRYSTLDRPGYVEPKFTNGSQWRIGRENYQDFSNRDWVGPDGTEYTTSDTIATLADTGGSGLGSGEIKYTDNTGSGEIVSGSNDATSIQNAIDDASRGTQGIVIPDIDSALDWDTRVDTPISERGFTILTEGTPTVSIPGGYGNSYAIYKAPAPNASNDEIADYFIDSFDFDDPNEILDPAIYLADIKGSEVRNPIGNCPLVEIAGTNGSSNQNVIYNPFAKGAELKGNRGAVVRLTADAPADAADQNYVLFGFVNDNVNFVHTGFLDEGRQNNWLYQRAEGVDTIFDMGGNDYIIKSGGWDRAGDYHFTVKEQQDSEGGTIELQRAANFGPAEIHSPVTDIRCRGDFYTETDQKGPVADLFAGVRRITPAMSFAAMGFQDSSSGGSVSKTASFSDHVQIELDAGNSTNDYAQLDMGNDAFKQQAFPRPALSMRHPGSGGQYVLRFGVVDDNTSPTNRVELIYDPQGDVTSGGDTWYFEVENGTVSTSTDTGIANGGGNGGGEGDIVSLGVTEDAGAGSTSYYCSVNGAGRQFVGASGDNFGQATFRMKIRTLDGGNQGVDIRGRDGVRFYRV